MLPMGRSRQEAVETQHMGIRVTSPGRADYIGGLHALRIRFDSASSLISHTLTLQAIKVINQFS